MKKLIWLVVVALIAIPLLGSSACKAEADEEGVDVEVGDE